MATAEHDEDEKYAATDSEWNARKWRAIVRESDDRMRVNNYCNSILLILSITLN